MRGIKVAHIFHLRHILTPIIVVIVLELCDFEVFLGFGKGSDGMIQLLKLCLSDIGKAPDLIIELFIELLALEEDPVLREIEHEAIVMVLV